MQEAVASSGEKIGVPRIVAAVAGGLLGAALVVWAIDQTLEAGVEEPGDTKQRELFVRRHPCPATSRIQAECAGYTVTYIKPLCAGGVDRAANMRWLKAADAKKKERADRKICAKAGRG